MVTRLLIFLCNISPALRRALWRWWYGKLARQIKTSNWTFMNYGYVAKNPPTLQLLSDDENDRLCIQLYECVVSPVKLEGARVLEIGSGRGGGASYLTRYHHPKHVIGMDYSAEAVAWCKERHKGVSDLEFVVGDAENIPFPNASFDVVVNVESSHCYGNVEKFFQEVIRVLKPGGHFVYADLRGATEMEQLKASLNAQTDLEKIDEENITGNVAAALEADDLRKRKMISDLIPPGLHSMFEEFAGVAGGQVSRGLRSEELLYMRFAFRRK